MLLAADELKRAEEAKRKILDGAETLWNSRLELLANAGDLRALLSHLTSPVEVAGDNCSCNSGCGALGPGGVVSDPGSLARR